MQPFMGVRYKDVLDPKTKELVLLSAAAKMNGAATHDLQQTIALAMMVRAAGVKNFVKGGVPEFAADDAAAWRPERGCGPKP